MYLGRTRYGVSPVDLTLNMVVEIVRESAASQGCQFLLNGPNSLLETNNRHLSPSGTPLNLI